MGSGAAGFRGWRENLPHDWRFTVAVPPGRDGSYGQPFATDMAQLADDLAAALSCRRSGPDSPPLVLFGHSMGGLLALLVADRVRTDALVVAACPAPSALEPGAAASHAADVPLDEARLRTEVAAMITSAPGMESDVLDALDELADFAMPVVAADIRLMSTFRAPQEPVGCGIWALYGQQDAIDPASWSAQTTASSGMSVLPGSHFFVQEDPARAVTELRRCVAKLTGSAS